MLIGCCDFGDEKELKMKVVKDCVAKVGGIHTKMGLRLDVITRWNSTFFYA